MLQVESYAELKSKINRCDKEFIEKLNYSGIEFPVSQKQYIRLN